MGLSVTGVIGAGKVRIKRKRIAMRREKKKKTTTTNMSVFLNVHRVRALTATFFDIHEIF